MKSKEFYRRWRQGMKELTPEQYTKAKMQGHYWAVVGLIFGISLMFYNKIYYFSIFLFALIWLQWWEYKATKQKYKGMVKLRQEMTEMNKKASEA